MDITIIAIITLTTFIQSIFGVGILLFGTPLMLLNNISFIDTLTILLPISMIVNINQIVMNKKCIDLKLLKNNLIFTIPIMIVTILFILQNRINFNLIVGIFLILASLMAISDLIKSIIKFLLRHEKLYMLFMGSIHGLTNLGGSLLTPFVQSKYKNKYMIRTNIAVIYLLFAFFQVFTIFFQTQKLDIKFEYLALGIIIYFLSNNFLFKKLSSDNYTKYFSFFLFVIGSTLVLKTLN